MSEFHAGAVADGNVGIGEPIIQSRPVDVSAGVTAAVASPRLQAQFTRARKQRRHVAQRHATGQTQYIYLIVLPVVLVTSRRVFEITFITKRL